MLATSEKANLCQASRVCAQVAEKSDVIFIAVKPQYVGTVLKEVKGQLKKETIIVSIAAGVPLAAMKVRQQTAAPQNRCIAP